MIKTGDWTIADLARYLASVQTTLAEKEWKKLRATAAFLAEGKSTPDPATGRPPRFAANQLYEPTPALRELGLPLLDWGAGNKWKAASDEAKFLFHLGLQRVPPAHAVLALAAGADEAARAKALRYFLDNFTRQYAMGYKVEDVANLAFVPARVGDKAVLAKPTEVRASAARVPCSPNARVGRRERDVGAARVRGGTTRAARGRAREDQDPRAPSVCRARGHALQEPAARRRVRAPLVRGARAPHLLCVHVRPPG
jgi:hypothetical protein